MPTLFCQDTTGRLNDFKKHLSNIKTACGKSSHHYVQSQIDAVFCTPFLNLVFDLNY